MTRRAVLQGATAVLGTTGAGCHASVAVPPAKWSRPEAVRHTVLPDEYVVAAGLSSGDAQTLLGKPAIPLSMGGVAIDMGADSIVGRVSRSTHEQAPLALQVNHQRAYLAAPKAGDSRIWAYDEASCSWDASSIVRVSGALETMTLQPSSLDDASPSVPYVLAVTSGPRANSVTSCEDGVEPESAVFMVRVGGVAGPPGSAQIVWSPSDGRLDLSCTLTPWTRVATHVVDSTSGERRLLWASDRYEFIRASSSSVDRLDPPFFIVDHRRPLAVGLRGAPTSVEVTFLGWDVPDVPRRVLEDVDAWGSLVEGLPRGQVRRVELPVG